MAKGIKYFIGIIVVVLLLAMVVAFAKRFHDGPVQILSGGPFTSGQPVSGVNNWAFLDEFATVELQTMNPPSSRVMWLVVAGNRPYVLSAYMNTRFGKVWKRWPRRIHEDNRAIVRADAKLYHFWLQRTFAPAAVAPVLKRFEEKYNVFITQEDIDLENTWLYELVPSPLHTGASLSPLLDAHHPPRTAEASQPRSSQQNKIL